jgi:hypothetical protein
MRGSKFLPQVVLAFAALGAASLAGGCAENRSSFYIAYAAALTSDEGNCKIELGTDVSFIATGQMDLIQTRQYAMTPVFANQLIPRSDPRLLRNETNIIHVEGAEITISALDGSAVENGAYSIPFSAIVYPNTDGEGQTGVILPVVPPGVITEVGQYLLEIRAYGRTTGGTPIETPAFYYPLEACEGCLAVCPTDPAETELIAPPCLGVWGSDYPIDARHPRYGGTCP